MICVLRLLAVAALIYFQYVMFFEINLVEMAAGSIYASQGKWVGGMSFMLLVHAVLNASIVAGAPRDRVATLALVPSVLCLAMPVAIAVVMSCVSIVVSLVAIGSVLRDGELSLLLLMLAASAYLAAVFVIGMVAGDKAAGMLMRQSFAGYIRIYQLA